MVRPTKLNPRVASRLVDAISQGASYRVACDYAGISYQTLLNWRKRAQKKEREDDERFLELFDHMEQVRGEAAVVLLGRIEEAADRHWRAAAWKLERLFPDSYGRQRSVGARETETSSHAPAQPVELPGDNIAEIVSVLSEMGFFPDNPTANNGSVQKGSEYHDPSQTR